MFLGMRHPGKTVRRISAADQIVLLDCNDGCQRISDNHDPQSILKRCPSTTVLQIISGAVHSKWGSKGVTEEDTWRAEYAWLRSNRDYDVRRVRGEPRGLNSDGSFAVRSSSRSARTEGEKRLLSATRKP